MSNMSYCRFVNTVDDLEDCYDALLDGKEISEAEMAYAHRLLDLCEDIVNDNRSGAFSVIEEANK